MHYCVNSWQCSGCGLTASSCSTKHIVQKENTSHWGSMNDTSSNFIIHCASLLYLSSLSSWLKTTVFLQSLCRHLTFINKHQSKLVFGAAVPQLSRVGALVLPGELIKQYLHQTFGSVKVDPTVLHRRRKKKMFFCIRVRISSCWCWWGLKEGDPERLHGGLSLSKREIRPKSHSLFLIHSVKERAKKHWSHRWVHVSLLGNTFRVLTICLLVKTCL